MLLISFLITGVILYYFLGDFLSNEKVQLLERSSDNVSETFEQYLNNLDSSFAQYIFKQ